MSDPSVVSDSEQFLNGVTYEVESAAQQLWATLIFWGVVWIVVIWYCVQWCCSRISGRPAANTAIDPATVQQQRENALRAMEQRQRESRLVTEPIKPVSNPPSIVARDEHAARSELIAAQQTDFLTISKSFKTKLTNIRIAESSTQETDIEIYGWLLRFIFQVVREGEKIGQAPASVTALFMSEHDDDYTQLPGLDELSQFEGSVGAVDVEELLLLHSQDSLSYYCVCCERLDHRGIQSDLNLSNLLSSKRELIHTAIQKHLFPILMESSDASIGTFLDSCTPSTLLRLLSSTNQLEIQSNVIHRLVEYILIRGGSDRNPVLVNHLPILLGNDTNEWEWLANSIIAGEIRFGFLSRCPDVADAGVALRGLPKYPVVSEGEIAAVLSAPRRVSETVLLSTVKMITKLLKTTSKEGIISFLEQIINRSNPRRKADYNAVHSLMGHSHANERFLLSTTVLILILTDPVSINKVNHDELTIEHEGTISNFSTHIFKLALESIVTVIIPSLRLLRKLREQYYRGLQMFVSQAGLSGQQINWEHISSQIPEQIKNLATMTDLHKAALLSPILVDNLSKFTLKIITNPIPLPITYLNATLDWLLYLTEHDKEYLETSELSPKSMLEWALSETQKEDQGHLFKARVLILINTMQASRPSNNGPTYGNAWDTSSLNIGHVSVVSLWHHVVSNGNILRQLPTLIFDVYTGMKRASGYDITTEEHIYEGAKQNALSVFKSLITVEGFKDEIVKQLSSATGNHLISEFASSVITASIHSLDDSLLRLTEVNDMEKILNDTAGWNRLPAVTQEQHKQKLSQQRQSAAGFMSGAMGTLRVLQMLLNPKNDSEQTTIFPALETPSVVKTASHFVVYFMNILYSRRCTDLQTIHNPRDLNYDFYGILEVLVNLLILLRNNTEFKQSVLEHDDCEISIFNKSLEDITRTSLGGIRFMNGLSEFIEKLTEHETVKAKNQDEEVAWNPPTDTLVVDDEKFIEELEDYTNTIEDLGSASGYSDHLYRREIRGEISGTKKRALMKDKKLLNDLPLCPSASIFCITDESRLDVHRFVISGAEGTPFSFGLFIFDVFCPELYPTCAPNFLIRTTGSGTVRITPNLYEDGRVCLSLLNTWHGDDEDMKWQPSKSTLYQVALAIQSQIMVPDPYFGEPGADKWINTPQGKKYSSDYNEPRRLITLREAVLANLLNPPAGCSDLFKTYFSLMSDKILQQACIWLDEASDEYRSKFIQVIGQLKEAFSQLEPSKCCSWV